jgi:UDP-N-acetylmuramyl pentapeptide phosphotransferase/UDP-N-acetylglucosamine-1-phosphate transferase
VAAEFHGEPALKIGAFTQMRRIPTRVGVALFIGIAVVSVLLWFHVARQMPLRYFAWFCLLTVAFITIELIVAKSLGERIKQNRVLSVTLEIALGSIFVAMFYWFAVYVYPGTR